MQAERDTKEFLCAGSAAEVGARSRAQAGSPLAVSPGTRLRPFWLPPDVVSKKLGQKLGSYQTATLTGACALMVSHLLCVLKRFIYFERIIGQSALTWLAPQMAIMTTAGSGQSRFIQITHVDAGAQKCGLSSAAFPGH